MINMIQLKLLSDEQLQMKTEFNLEAHSGIQKILSGGPGNIIFCFFSHREAPRSLISAWVIRLLESMIISKLATSQI